MPDFYFVALFPTGCVFLSVYWQFSGCFMDNLKKWIVSIKVSLALHAFSQLGNPYFFHDIQYILFNIAFIYLILA